MSRPWPSSRLTREVAQRLGLVEHAVLDNDELVVSSDGLRRKLALYKDKADRDVLLWQVFVGDEKFHDTFDHGGVWIDVLAPTDRVPHLPAAGRRPDAYRWPQSGQDLPENLAADLVRYALPALAFVQDRSDLARLLLEDGEVHRGDLVASLTEATSASRLVKAVVLARDIPDQEVDKLAFDKLARRRATPTPGSTYGEDVAYWAREYAKQVAIDLGDLRAASRRRG